MKEQIEMYNWQTQEHLMLKVWHDAVKDGTLETVFGASAQHLSSFLDFVRKESTVAISVDDKGIWFIIATQPLFEGVIVNMWVREDRRKSPAVGRLAREAHQQIFTVAKSAVCCTRDHENIQLFQHFGYKPCGKLTGIWGGQDVYFLEMTNGR